MRNTDQLVKQTLTKIHQTYFSTGTSLGSKGSTASSQTLGLILIGLSVICKESMTTSRLSLGMFFLFITSLASLVPIAHDVSPIRRMKHGRSKEVQYNTTITLNNLRKFGLTSEPLSYVGRFRCEYRKFSTFSVLFVLLNHAN